MFSDYSVTVAREKTKVRLALAIPTGAPGTLVNKIFDTPLLVALEAIQILSTQSKVVKYLLNFVVHDFL